MLGWVGFAVGSYCGGFVDAVGRVILGWKGLGNEMVEG